VLAATAVDRLDQAECWRLLGWAHLGRLATSSGERMQIFPVNYLVRDESILFRSAAGTKLTDLMERPEVAFEIDGEDSRWHWSVVVHGRAEVLHGDAEIIQSGVLELVSWSPTDKFNYVRLTPDYVTGRRIDRHEFRRSSMVG
jgi:nitroimidazol reductase NimA-like FMN-containing flavoprotein (pyridoxamine 5'-phosphate oxidase superfamily)